MNVREEVTQVGNYTNAVVKRHPLDEPLCKAAWEALLILDYLHDEGMLRIQDEANALRKALATQGVTESSIAAFEEAKK